MGTNRVHDRKLANFEMFGLAGHFGDNSFISAWPTIYPDMLPPSRAARYIMCGKVTNIRGEYDAVAKHPYSRDAATWGRRQARPGNLY